MRSIQTGRSILAVAALGAALLAVSSLPARAENPVDSLREGALKAMEALRELAEELQRYGAPHFDKDGNIVIPRKEPGEDAPDTAETRQPEEQSITL